MEEEATRIQFAHLNQQTVVSCSCRRRSDGGAAGGEQGPASEFQSGGASRGRHCSWRQGKGKKEPAQQGPAASLLPAHSRAVADAGWGG